MAFGRWTGAVQDANGNALAGALVEVRRENTGNLATLYVDRDGLVPLANPFTAAEATVFFHAAGGSFRVTATVGTFVQTWRYAAVGTAGETDIEALEQRIDDGLAGAVLTIEQDLSPEQQEQARNNIGVANTSGLYTSVALVALEVADLKGGRVPMSGGYADAFDDESGVNGTASTNEVYDAVNDRYGPTVVLGSDQTATHTAATTSGNTVSASSVVATGYEGWRAFDKASAQWNTSEGNVVGAWLRYQFSAAKVIGEYTLQADTTYPNRMPGGWTLQGSNTGSFSGEQTTLDTRSGQIWTAGQQRSFTISTPASFIYYRIVVSAAAAGGDNYINIQEVTLRPTSTISNMTIISVPWTLQQQPYTGRLRLALETAATVNPAVDFRGRMSRDGGTTWSTGTFSLVYQIGNIKVYEANDFDFSSHPAGTSMVYEFATLTNKNIALTGAVPEVI